MRAVWRLTTALTVGLAAALPSQLDAAGGELGEGLQERATMADRMMTTEADRAERPGAEALLARTAGLEVEAVPVEEALLALREGSGIDVVFSPTALPDDRRVTCDCRSASVGAALDRILGDAALGHRVHAGAVLVVPEETEPEAEEPAAEERANAPLEARLAGQGGTGPALRTLPLHQQGTIIGRVVAAGTGEPLEAATVNIPDTELGTLTGADGSFTLDNVPAGTHTLQAERIGYAPASETVTVGADETVEITIELAQQALALDEVVVTGVAGGEQRRAVGNVVSRLDAQALQEVAPAAHMEQLIGQRTAGVQVMPSAGQIGADGGQIRIRGTSSVGLPNDPIVYVDGIRINTSRTGVGRDGARSPLNDIHPSEIESLEIIKGPAAATLYGTEASNGVIQIITRRGAEGAPVFDFSAEAGFNYLADERNRVPDTYSMVDGQVISHNMLDTWEQLHGESLFQRGPIQRYSLGVRGGTETLRYSANASWDDQEGILDFNWEERWSARGNLSLHPLDGLDITVSGAATRSEARRAGNYWMYLAWGNPGTSSVVNPGSDDAREGFYVRPFDVHGDGQEIMQEVDRSQWNVEVQYQPWDWFTTRLVAGTDVTHEDRHTTTLRDPLGSGGLFGLAGLGQKSINSDEVRVNTVDYAGTFSFRATESLGSATSFGFQYYKRAQWNRWLWGRDMPTRATTTIGTAADLDSSEDYIENVTVGGYIQQQVDWNERLYVTAAVRMDDNSAFGADFDAAIYPKLSATWTLHEEPFWDVDWVSQFRLRSAFGAAGQQPDVFDAVRLYASVPGPEGQPMATPQAVGNPDLQPERGEELELGFDAGFLEDRISLELTHYRRTTRDAIVARGLAPSDGFPGTQLVNIGEIDNWGTEAELGLQVLDQDPVRWDLNLSFATMNNEVVDLGEEVDQLTVRRTRFHREGYPLASIFDYVILDADFIEGNSGEVENLICDGGTGPDGLRPGGDPVPCSEAPLLFYGPSEPTWQMNVSSNFNILRDWELFFSVDARGGHMHAEDGVNARHTSFCNTELCWTQDDPIFMAHRQIRRQPLGFYDAGFARLREVAVSYHVPEEFVNRFGADRASVRFAMRNVALLWQEQEYTRWGPRVTDPEQGLPFEEFGGESALEPPPLSHATVQLRLTF